MKRFTNEMRRKILSMEFNNMELCEVLWKEYEPYLRKICNFRLSDYPDEAEDVIGEAYLALCDVLNSGQELKNPKAWLYGTVNNYIKIKYIEIDRNKHCVNLDNVNYKLCYDVDFDSARIDEDALDKIKDDILESLDEEDRAILSLYYEEHHHFKEIARILNSTESAVKQRHYRMKRKVKELIKEKLENL